jgi:hypothetical protein
MRTNPKLPCLTTAATPRFSTHQRQWVPFKSGLSNCQQKHKKASINMNYFTNKNRFKHATDLESFYFKQTSQK